jgi:hypothetical protein
MSDDVMALIEILAIQAIEVTHRLRKIGGRRFDHQMKVIAHLAVAVDDALVPFAGLLDDLQPHQAVGIVAIDDIAAIAARSDMVEGACEF